eukprot:scaffold13358_cov198-Alexandrium_tamarense.AAC.22
MAFYQIFKFLPSSSWAAVGMVSTLMGLWIIKATLAALQSFQAVSLEKEKPTMPRVDDGETDPLMMFHSKFCSSQPSSSEDTNIHPSDLQPPMQSKILTEAHDTINQGEHKTRISCSILAICITVMLQFGVRVFVLIHNIRRRWLARKQSISAVKSRLISFSEIPFTIRDTSGGGRHFYLFSYLNEFVRGDSMGNSRAENASDGNMILQAVSFERFAINSSHVLVGSSKRQQRNVVPEKCTLSPSSSSSSLALSLGDIQLSLTILLKRKQRIGTTQSTTEEESRCARSITVSLKIKSLEFGCFPYLFDRVQVRGVGFDVDAVFASVTSVDKANSNVTGIGMSVSCKRVGMNTFCSNEKRIGRPPFLGSSTKRSNVVSWDKIQSTFYDQRLLSGFDDYSALERTNVALVSLPMGYIVVQPADEKQSPPTPPQQSPSTRQALVSLGRGSSTKDELIQHFALGIDFEATHRFIPLMELLLQNAFCSLVRNNTEPTDALIEVSTKTKLKTTSKIELVEVNATGYASLYALLSKSSHDVDIGHGHEAVSMKAANTTAQWRKRNSLDSNSSFNRAVPNNSSAVALVIVKDLCVYCHSSLDSDLDIIRIVGVSSETAWWLQQVENKPLPRTSSDVGGVLLRLDSEVIGRFALLNNDLQTTKVLGNALQRRLNGLEQKLSKDQVDGLKRKINHPSFDALNLSCASVDAIVELQIPSERNNNNDNNVSTVRLALLQGQSSSRISFREAPVQLSVNKPTEGNISDPDSLFESELRKCHASYVVESRVSRMEFSVTFVPHSSLPTIGEMKVSRNQESTFYGQLTGLGLDLASPRGKPQNDADPRTQLFAAKASEVRVYEIPNKLSDVSLFSVPVHVVSFRQHFVDSHVGWPMAQTYSADYNIKSPVDILKCRGTFCRVEKRDTVAGKKMELISIQLSRNVSSDLYFVWSPVFQWLQMSCNTRIQQALAYVKSLASTSPTSKQGHSCHETIIRVGVDPTTVANICTCLGVKSVMTTVIEGGMTMDISMVKYLTPVVRTMKPNMIFRAGGRVQLFLNEITQHPIFAFSNVFFKNVTRRAFDDEIAEYNNKKEAPLQRYDDEIVVDHDGHPIKELFEVTVASCVTKFHPSLHFGEVIDDFLLTPRALDAGMDSFKSTSNKRKKRYQLMTITGMVSFLDISLLGDGGSGITDDTLHDVARAYFEGLNLSIERNSPPELTQSHITALDEDTLVYTYGPSIQGGLLQMTIDHFVFMLLPLNLATPLVRINDFAINGSLYLTGLSPSTPGIQEGRTVKSLLLCHHMARECGGHGGCFCCSYGVSLHSAGIPVKVYTDCTVVCSELDVSYGPVMNTSIPQLMECIQRLLPPPSKSAGDQDGKFVDLTTTNVIIQLDYLTSASVLDTQSTPYL